MSKTIFSIVLLGLFVGAVGCAKPLYFEIADQFYMTRGASEAILGSYGIVDTLGFDSFERLGYKPEHVEGLQHSRTLLKSAVDKNLRITGKGTTQWGLGGDFPWFHSVFTMGIQADFNDVGTKVITLDVIDVDKDTLVKNLNEDTELKAQLWESSRYRIITAVAEIVDYNEVRKRVVDANITSESPQNSKPSVGVELGKMRHTVIEKGSVYAYQMSHIEWHKDGSQTIVGLKTDRPVFSDELTNGLTIHGKKKVGNGERRDYKKRYRVKADS